MSEASAAVDRIFVLIIGVNLIIIGVLALVSPFIPILKDKASALSRSFTVLLGVALIATGGFLSCKFIKNPTIDSIEEDLRIAAESKNEEAPMIIAEGLRLDSVRAEGKKLLYKETFVNLSSNQFDPDKAKMVFTETLAKSLCTGEGTRDFLDKGVSFHYDYYGKDGAIITSTSLNLDNCKIID